MIYTPNHLQIRIFNYLCRPKWKCGEIWLLATTLKNAKMLTERSSCPVTDIISMFCVFCDGSAFLWGFFYARGAGRRYLILLELIYRYF